MSPSTQVKAPLPLHLLAALPSSAPIRIGLPIDTAAHGAGLIVGAYLAIAHHRQQGGAPVRAIWRDDHRNAEGGRAAAEHLVRDGVSYVIGHFSSRAAMTAAPVYAAGGTLFLAPGASAPDLTAAPDTTTVLRLFGRDDTQADAIVAALQQTAPGNMIIELFAEDNRYGRSISDLLKASFDRAGRHCRVTILHDGDDIGSNATGPVILAGTHEFSAHLLQRLATTRCRIVSDDAFNAAFLHEAGAAGDAVMVPVIGFDARSSDVVRLHAAYRDLLGHDPGGYFLTSYVATDLVLRTVRHLGDCGGVQAAAHLRSRSWPTALGELTFTSSGEVAGLDWRMARVAQGQFIVS